MKKRFIEVSFPFNKMSELSQKEKSAVSKTLSTLHIWWARRPLTLSRAVIAGCILSAPKGNSQDSESEKEKTEDLLGKACTLDAGVGGENPSTSLTTLINLIEEGFEDKHRLTLLDPFAGGGSIPFEARRLGLDVFSSDLNPVSFLLRKVSVELIPEIWDEKKEEKKEEILVSEGNSLLDDFDRWSMWLYKKAKKDLAQYFEKNTLNYLWVKICHCKSCGRKIPLLSMKVSREGMIVNPQVIVNKEKGTFEINLSSSDPSILRTRKGVICPFCETLTTTLEDVRNEARNHTLGYFPVCKYVQYGKKKRKFIPFTDKDLEQERKAKAALEEIRLDPAWRPFIPDEKTPSNSQLFSYGLDSFDKLYSPRQLLTVIILMKSVQQSAIELEKENLSSERKTLIVLLLSFLVDRFASKNTLLTTWYAGKNHLDSLFAINDLKMSWDFAEPSPIMLQGSGSFGSVQKSLRRAVKNCMIPVYGKYKDHVGSVTDLRHPDEFIDLVVTDPPYYDYIEYASLSDFFYVLLKRMLKKPLFDIFQTPLTPKNDELILKKGLSKKDKEIGIKRLEDGLLRGWKEVNRVLKKEGLLVVMFTHRSTKAWEQLFMTLHKAGFYAVATWPVLSERLTKYTQGRANVNTTLLIVCRKRNKEEQVAGDYRDVSEELWKTVDKKAKSFSRQGFSGAEFFVAIQGPAMEIFSKYDRIEKSSGEVVGLSNFIEMSQEFIGEFVLKDLFNIATPLTLDSLTRFYIMWRWSYGVTDRSIDDYLLFCKVNSIEEKHLEELNMVKKTGRKGGVYLNQYHERDLSWNNWKTDLRDQSVITRLHMALLLLSQSSYSSFIEFLDVEGIKDNGHIVVQVGRVLEKLLRPIVDNGSSVPEHTLLQKFLDDRGISFIGADNAQQKLTQ